MAVYSVPRTWATGELVTASMMNQYVRDEFSTMSPVGKLELFLEPSAGHGVENLLNGAWLECNNAAVSRTTYAALKAKIDPMKVAYSTSTTLATALPDGVGTAVVLAAWPADWPTDGRPFEMQIGAEIMLVTAGAGTPNLTAVRGVEGSAAAAHAANVAVTSPSQYPFGSGDGLLTFNVHDLYKAMPWGHGTDTFLGAGNLNAPQYRRAEHRHTQHDHGSGSSGGGTASGSNGGPSTGPTGFADGGSGNPYDPLNAPAYQIAGIWTVKTQ